MLLSFLFWLVLILSAVCMIPAMVLFLQCAAAAWPGKKPRPWSASVPGEQGGIRIAVLVPAHNEAEVILRTVRAIAQDLTADDRLLVVADNCEDETAAIASRAGAEVLERNDPVRRGKGWALAAGRDFLCRRAPDVLVIVDADCTAQRGTIRLLARRAVETARPVQAAFLMPPLADSGGFGTLSSFAVLVKNYVRPLGAQRLGLPCLLNGSGMALPWAIAESAPLAGGHIGEEYQLAVDLACDGRPPVFCPEAVVESPLPTNRAVARKQRLRWSHSHLAILASQAPRLLRQAAARRSLAQVGMALDLSVPPLVMLCVALAFLFPFGLALALLGSSPAAAALPAAGMLLVGAAVLLAWLRFGKERLRSQALWSIPGYLVVHAPHYFRFFIHRHTAWTKTPRDRTPSPRRF